MMSASECIGRTICFNKYSFECKVYTDVEYSSVDREGIVLQKLSENDEQKMLIQYL